jgi:hypothetical protein
MVASAFATGCTDPATHVGTTTTQLCSTAGLNSDSVTGSGPAGTVVHWTATSGCDVGDNAEYEIWELPPGGSWQLAQGYSATATYTFDTTGAAAGTYDFQVWVRAQGSTAAFESVAYGSFAVTGTGACTGVSVTPTVPSPQVAGTMVTLDAGATGCANPRYAFYELAPGGSWTLMQDFSATATYSFDTSSSGNYSFQVWVRDASSTGAYDAYSQIAYTITAGSPACTNATLTPSVQSPQAVNSGVTFSASASTCGNPQFAFYELAPGGSWTLMQPYSSNSHFTFDTTGSAGTYNFQVWVRDGSSVATYDTYATQSFTLFSGSPSQPCANATLTMPVTTGLNGTSLTLTATSTTCTNPRYAFFELAPGGSWQLAQDFSSTATFNFTDPTNGPAGDYQFQVWVKDASSAASSDTYAGITYTSGFASAATSHVTLADGTVRDTSFHGTVCPNAGIVYAPPGFGTWLAVCTVDQGVWYGGILNSSTQATIHDPVWAQNNGQVVFDPTNGSQTGQFPTFHGTGVATFAGGGGQIAFFTSDAAGENWGRANTFATLDGPLAYPGTNVIWRQDSTPSGTYNWPQTITAALIGSSTNNYLATFDGSGNTVLMHGNTIPTTITKTTLGAGTITAPVSSIVTGVVSAAGPTNRDVHLTVFASGASSKGGGIYWSCNTTGTAYAEDDSGISATDKTQLYTLAADPSTFSTNQAVARTCGAVTGIKDYTLVMYAGVQGGSSLYKTADGGATWAVSNTGLPAGVTVWAIALDPITTSTVYAATSAGLYRSTSSGASWSLVGLAGKNVRAVAVGGHANGALPRIFAGTDEPNGLYQTYAPPGAATFSGTSAVACTGANLTSSPATSGTAGTNVVFSASSSSCAGAYYAFYMLPPGGTWTQVQAYSPRSQYTFQTTASTAGGNYAFQVWVRDASSTVALDTSKQLPFALTSPSEVACTGATLVPSVAGPQPVGTPVTLTAGSSACTNPQYSFYELAPGGSWTLVQGPSATTTYNFNTSGAAGDYSFQVWVTDQNSTATIDTSAGLGYTLTP